jgi:hypothetical protein
MLERIVFHIGTHKTGTTAIQESLGKAYDSLLARGILYPRAGRAGPGHAQLARELLSTDVPPANVPSHLEILEEVRTVRPATLVVSSEQLLGVGSPRPVEWARHLCEEIQPAHVHVLGYVRPQWGWIESQYAVWVRTGRRWASFEHALEPMMADKRFDYLETFSPWRQAFGDRLELRPYGADLLLGGDAVTDFWKSASGRRPTPRVTQTRDPAPVPPRCSGSCELSWPTTISTGWYSPQNRIRGPSRGRSRRCSGAHADASKRPLPMIGPFHPSLRRW